MFELQKIVSLLMLPPAVFMVLAVLLFLLRRRWPRTGNTLLWLNAVTFYVCSTGYFSVYFLSHLQGSPLLLSQQSNEQTETAIVVLGAGTRPIAAEFDNASSVTALTLERLRYAARLQRQTGLPVLLSGGSPLPATTPEAVTMNEVMLRDFSVSATWLETQSRTTRENAQFSVAVLRQAGIKTVYLVTHAWHMPRAEWAFAQYGIRVIAAPMGYAAPSDVHSSIAPFLPSAQALQQSYFAAHEYLGLFWYQLRD